MSIHVYNTCHIYTLQHTATHCNTLQHTATHCNTLQHTATHCNTLPLYVTTRHRFRHSTSHILQYVHITSIQYTSHICMHTYIHTYTHTYCMSLHITYIAVCPQYVYTEHVTHIACHYTSHILHTTSYILYSCTVAIHTVLYTL